jgi:hypothetical protein
MSRLNALGFLLLPALFILNLGAETVTDSPLPTQRCSSPILLTIWAATLMCQPVRRPVGRGRAGFFDSISQGRTRPSAVITSVSLQLTVTKVPTGLLEWVTAFANVGAIPGQSAVTAVLRPVAEATHERPLDWISTLALRSSGSAHNRSKSRG